MVGIEGRELAKAGTRGGSEEFGAGIHAAVAVLVQRKVAAAGGKHRQLFGAAIRIEVEGKTLIGELGGAAVEVDQQ